jgi:hypothetical protein
VVVFNDVLISVLFNCILVVWHFTLFCLEICMFYCHV